MGIGTAARCAPVRLLVTQPVDHANPNGADNEISFVLGGNSITVEHRYYEGSIPANADPRFLTIRQAAADHHRIVQLLRPIYTGKWISTGASKGGMTSIYHRRYYPNDVDATVAYVAPQSYTTNDVRYGVFLERVGSQECRQRVIDTQRLFLDRRAELLPIFEAWAAEQGATFDHVGGLPLAFEHAVTEFRFAFTTLARWAGLVLPAQTAARAATLTVVEPDWQIDRTHRVPL